MGADADTTAATAAMVTPLGTRPTIPTVVMVSGPSRTASEVTSDGIKLEDVNDNLQLGDIPLAPVPPLGRTTCRRRLRLSSLNCCSTGSKCLEVQIVTGRDIRNFLPAQAASTAFEKLAAWSGLSHIGEKHLEAPLSSRCTLGDGSWLNHLRTHGTRPSNSGSASGF